MKEITLKATYDSEVDAVYIYFTEAKPGMVTSTYSLEGQDDPVVPDINIDAYDNNSKLLGMEILDASHYLPESLLVQLQINSDS